jgi:hypothetical protein
MHQKLTYVHSDLASSDYYLLPYLKKCLMGREFERTEGATFTVDG